MPLDAHRSTPTAGFSFSHAAAADRTDSLLPNSLPVFLSFLHSTTDDAVIQIDNAQLLPVN